MLIDGVVMIHVELHLRIDPAEIGYEAAKYPRFVHPAQHRFGIVAARKQLEEQRIGLRVLAHIGSDQRAVAISQAHGFRVDLQTVGFSQLEDFDQPHRILAKPVIAAILPPNTR